MQKRLREKPASTMLAVMSLAVSDISQAGFNSDAGGYGFSPMEFTEPHDGIRSTNLTLDEIDQRTDAEDR